MALLTIFEITETGFYVQLRSGKRPEMAYIIVNDDNTLTFTREANSTPCRVQRAAMAHPEEFKKLGYIKIESDAPGYQDWRGDDRVF